MMMNTVPVQDTAVRLVTATVVRVHAAEAPANGAARENLWEAIPAVVIMAATAAAHEAPMVEVITVMKVLLQGAMEAEATAITMRIMAKVPEVMEVDMAQEALVDMEVQKAMKVLEITEKGILQVMAEAEATAVAEEAEPMADVAQAVTVAAIPEMKEEITVAVPLTVHPIGMMMTAIMVAHRQEAHNGADKEEIQEVMVKAVVMAARKMKDIHPVMAEAEIPKEAAAMADAEVNTAPAVQDILPVMEMKAHTADVLPMGTVAARRIGTMKNKQ